MVKMGAGIFSLDRIKIGLQIFTRAHLLQLKNVSGRGPPMGPAKSLNCSLNSLATSDQCMRLGAPTGLEQVS